METVKRPRVRREGGIYRQTAEGFWVVRVCDTTMVRDMCQVAQSCPTLWDSMDYSLSGSFVHGILQV